LGKQVFRGISRIIFSNHSGLRAWNAFLSGRMKLKQDPIEPVPLPIAWGSEQSWTSAGSAFFGRKQTPAGKITYNSVY